uniref:Tad domain-containing protein n=1 Tax=Parerythrobacter lutipelagi TaxID=1964208 RepID=UPI0010F803BC|nr:Tad domain-containing protein [Parerythrobacter lutipelagi]
MAINLKSSDKKPAGPFLNRLAHDRSGNTMVLVAAALLPLLGMIGGAVDMSRTYMASAKIQQACDSGVLAARKKLGSIDATTSSKLPKEVEEIGDRFFNINFRDGNYATEDREFRMTLERDQSISGVAEVNVPTSVMGIFGVDVVPVAVSCEAQMNFSNVDVMMALDVTGSMRHTNSGDSKSRIDSLKDVIRDFHSNLESNKGSGIRVRYGFVPYATNVNVGHLLKNNWVASDWTYQSRELAGDIVSEYNTTYYDNWKYVSGTASAWMTQSSYAATWVPGTPPSGGSGDQGGSSGSSGYYRCDGSQPSDTITQNDVLIATATEPYLGPPSGTKTIETFERTQNGIDYTTARSGSTCEVRRRTYDNYKQTFDRITHPKMSVNIEWLYKPIKSRVGQWRIETPGCIEERNTYHIDDPATVDLTRALDLDLDLVPDPKNPDTQWRPHYQNLIYVRSLNSSGNGSIIQEEVRSTSTFARTGTWWFSDCPPKAQKLQELSEGALDTYLSTLNPAGATYHDIGMIWAGRLISPSGLFAIENRDVSFDKPTNRNLIFLTDGQTEPYDIAYGAYGVEALDRRRWDESSTNTLVETVDARFLIACNEVKKRNINVWVIAFGTTANDAMIKCAGAGRYFEASDADQLKTAFRKISESFGNLRISE